LEFHHLELSLRNGRWWIILALKYEDFSFLWVIWGVIKRFWAKECYNLTSIHF
jgi:hypothetical protein